MQLPFACKILQAAKVCLENSSHSLENCEMIRESLMLRKHYIEEVLKLLESHIPVNPLNGILTPVVYRLYS